ncbi:MAG: UDP-glucose 4-epimerase [Solirubrobacteraceae bacterium]|nr:UDP-glucose 4-epimerase [Solirubrobacteraceae bacterium]
MAVGREGLAGAPEAWKVVQSDLSELDMSELLAEHTPDVVFHLANTALVPPSVSAPLDDLVANAGTTVGVLEALRRLASPPVLVFVSSAAVYGTAQEVPMDEDHPLRPVSPYGVSKLASEQYIRLYCELHGLHALSARPFSVYGPRQRKLVVYDLLRRLAEGEDPLRIAGSPEVSRDFVWVGDAVRGLLTLAREAPARGEPYNIASGVETTLGDLVEQLIKVSGGAMRAEFNGVVRPGDPLRWAGDPRRAAALGVACDTPLSVGLQLTAEWLLRETIS